MMRKHGLMLLCLCGLINGCSLLSSQASLPKQAEQLNEALASGGYTALKQLAITSQRDNWTLAGTALDVMVTAPSQAGRYPLVIYLPSLGEAADAAPLWREAWAKAGYVVISVQAHTTANALKALDQESGFDPEALDKAAEANASNWLPSFDSGLSEQQRQAIQQRQARNSEIRYLGHEAFATAALRQRLLQLDAVYQELQRRQASGQALYAAADLRRIVLAGYDLGAQTVAAAVGERVDTAPLPVLSFTASAAIALSPSVNLAQGQLSRRYQAITLPLLVVTGPDDHDPYAISSANVRQALWENAAPGQKWLLSLPGASHRLFNGSELGGRFERGMRDGIGAGYRGQAYPLMPMQLGNQGRRQGGDYAETYFPNEVSADRARLAQRGYQQVAAIIMTTTAFLDSVTQQDRLGSGWLGDAANRWLKQSGQLLLR
jgi:dienelactone hydrolase